MAQTVIDEVALREPRLLVPNSIPIGNTKINATHPLASGLIWFGLPTFAANVLNSAFGHRNMVSRELTTVSDINNYIVRNNGIAGGPVFDAVVGSSSTAVNNIYSGSLFNGLTTLTLSAGILRNPNDSSSQQLHFRIDFEMSLDVFSVTSTSTTWGSDWFGAWNGASQQTINVGNGPVNMMACIRQNGARLFHNGAFAAEKSGSGGDVTGTSVQIIQGGNYDRLYVAAWKRALSDAEAISFTRDPYQILIPA